MGTRWNDWLQGVLSRVGACPGLSHAAVFRVLTVEREDTASYSFCVSYPSLHNADQITPVHFPVTDEEELSCFVLYQRTPS